jgi:hypothetical protein
MNKKAGRLPSRLGQISRVLSMKQGALRSTTTRRFHGFFVGQFAKAWISQGIALEPRLAWLAIGSEWNPDAEAPTDKNVPS